MTMRLFAHCIFAVLRTSQEQLGSTSTASLCAFFKACVAPALQSIHARSVLRLHSHRGLNSQTSFENGCIILYTFPKPLNPGPLNCLRAIGEPYEIWHSASSFGPLKILSAASLKPCHQDLKIGSPKALKNSLNLNS